MKYAWLGIMMAASMFGATSVHEFSMKAIDGNQVSLSDYKGKVLLLVNVASRCGYTKQYSKLEALYRKYKDRGLVVVGVPANNFGGQEPGTDQEIQTFCKRNYDVTFPMMSKVSVKGDDKTPLYQYLTAEAGGEVKWNFTKFLAGKDGKVVTRFEPAVEPDSQQLEAAVEQALARQ